MRNELEIQRTHDLLAGILLEEAPSPFDVPMSTLQGMAASLHDTSKAKDVDPNVAKVARMACKMLAFVAIASHHEALCWVLSHDCPTAGTIEMKDFSAKMKFLEEEMANKGYTLYRPDQN